MKRVRLLAWCWILATAFSNASAQEPLDIGARKQLFVDDTVVASSRGVSFAMNAPARTGRIVLKADAPWETAAEGHLGAYASILQDGGKPRLWYDVRFGDSVQVAYAESTDGLQFTKPVLGLHPLNGSTENNIVMPTRIGGSAVWIDPRADAGKRYRSQSKGYNPPTAQRLYCYHSPDGIHWTQWDAQDIGDCDTQSIAFWDGRAGRYVLYTRHNPNPKTPARSRIVRRLDSTDLQHWENEVTVMEADAADLATYPVTTPKPPVDYYGAAVFRYPDEDGVYIMLSQPFWHFQQIEEEVDLDSKEEFKGGRFAPATIDVRLACSRNGVDFRRLGERRPFLGLGPDGAFDSKIVWALPNPIPMNDELWFYYYGGNTDHDGVVDPNAEKAMTGIGLATLRLDGFVSADAAYTGGELTTKPLKFEGTRLELNLDTGAGGYARVEVLDEAGEPIAGYTLEDAALLCGNSVRMPVTWGPNKDLVSLAGKPIRLRFLLRDCKLYAFQFVS